MALLAARQGDEDAKKNITELESKLTREQIAEGQRRRAILSRGRRQCLQPESKNKQPPNAPARESFRIGAAASE